MISIRPKVLRKPNKIHILLREVVCCNVSNMWSKELWLFGNTKQRHSVAIKVDNFIPYFYMDKVDLSVQEVKSLMNSELNGCIVDVRKSHLIPVVGFCNNQPRDLFKIYYKNPVYLKKIRSFLQKHSFDVDGKSIIIKLYHDDWTITNLFLHERKVKLQEWIEVVGVHKYRNNLLTSCQMEMVSKMCNITTSPIQYPDCPVLICAIRIPYNIDSDKSDIEPIYIKIYWMGNSKSYDFVYNSKKKSINVQQFYNRINSADIDCFVFFSDTRNPLTEIAKQGSIRLGKFRNNTRGGGGLLVFENFTTIKHPGRSRMDIKVALHKMHIEPKLESFTLKSVIRHPRLLRNIKTVSIEPEDEIHYLFSIDKDNNLLLGYIQLSSACYTDLTVIVEGGQQVRVWNKLISKFHTRGLLVNKERFNSPVLIVKRNVSESAYPNPPELPNNPIILKKKKKQINLYGKSITENSFKVQKESKGGCVFQPIPGFYTIPTMIFDFRSLYPTIIQSDNVCSMRLLYIDQKSILNDGNIEVEYVPITDSECIVIVKKVNGVKPPTVLPEVTQEVCMNRIKLKKEMKQFTENSFEYKSLNAKQLACKVFQNALYGALGACNYSSDSQNPKPAFVIPVLMAMVCKIGQSMIRNVKHFFLVEYNAFVVYGDTDSVMIQIPIDYNNLSNEEVNQEITKLGSIMEKKALGIFKQPHVLELEKIYITSLFFSVKKMYAGLLLQDNRLEIKGLSFKNLGKCPWVRKIGYVVVESILKKKEGHIIPYLTTQFEQLISKQVPITDLSISCVLKRSDEYKSTTLIQVKTAEKILHRTGQHIQPGSRLTYVVISGNNKLFERGEPVDFVEKNNLDLDYEYYLNNQLSRAIDILLTHHPTLQKQTRNLIHLYVKKSIHNKRKAPSLFEFDTKKLKQN